LAIALAPPARHTRIIAATAAGVLAVGAIVVWQLWPRAATCEVPQVPAELWTAARRAEVDKHVPPEIAPRVDRWLASWRDAAAAMCASEGDEAVRMRRDRCEREQLDELDALLARWQAATAPVSPMSAHEDFEKLPLPSECGHAPMASRGDPTPEQLAQI